MVKRYIGGRVLEEGEVVKRYVGGRVVKREGKVVERYVGKW